MAGIDLTTASARLTAYLAYEETILTDGQAQNFDGNTLTHVDLAAVRQQIDFWDRRVKRLSRGSGVGIQRMIVND